MRKPKYYWNEEHGFASCTLFYKDMKFVGIAQVADEDLQYKSERNGCEIAFKRALINYLKWIKKYEIKPELKLVNNILSELAQSPKFNKKSYEIIHLFKRIRKLEYDLAVVEQMIADENKNLEEYIQKNDERNRNNSLDKNN